MAQVYPAIPDPSSDVDSLRITALAVKEGLEIITRQRGDRGNSAVTWNDLLALGIVTAAQIPKTPSSR